MKRIPLTRGLFALVDDQDFDLLKTRKWHATKKRKNGVCYAATRRLRIGGLILMHRLIAGAKAKQRVDHKNRNGLDNQRENLRFGSQSQNCANAKISSRNTSGFKGVGWHKAAKKWRAYVKGRHIGLFSNKRLAVEAYDRALISLFGDFALTNRQLVQS